MNRRLRCCLCVELFGHGRLVAFVVCLFMCSHASAQTDPTINVVNRGIIAIYNLYVSSVDSGSWGDDWLGDRTVQPGNSFRVAPPRGTCEFDVKVVYMDKREEERRRQNFCKISELVFTGTPLSPTGTEVRIFRTWDWQDKGRLLLQRDTFFTIPSDDLRSYRSDFLPQPGPDFGGDQTGILYVAPAGSGRPHIRRIVRLANGHMEADIEFTPCPLNCSQPMTLVTIPYVGTTYPVIRRVGVGATR